MRWLVPLTLGFMLQYAVMGTMRALGAEPVPGIVGLDDMLVGDPVVHDTITLPSMFPSAAICPPDRPHRLVVEMPGSTSRTTALCTKLVCHEGADRCTMVHHDDCNKTTVHRGSVIGMCLTDEELKAARVPK